MVINDFKSFEGVDNPHPVTSIIVGNPSGEAFEITYDIFLKLKEEHLIKYYQKYDAFLFKDANLPKIKNILINPVNIDYIKHHLSEFRITKYTINDDYSVDVFEDVDISQKKLNKIPIKFNKIVGDFDCAFNQLKNLVNSPREISGFFDCSMNQLYTLINGPVKVYDGYYCGDNNLEDLQGYPEEVYKVFDCSKNNIINLNGLPEFLECEDFIISHNLLKNLIGPVRRAINFDCSYNHITTLENGIREVENEFDCSYNRLKSLMGMPHCKKIMYVGNKVPGNGKNDF